MKRDNVKQYRSTTICWNYTLAQSQQGIQHKGIAQLSTHKQLNIGNPAKDLWRKIKSGHIHGRKGWGRGSLLHMALREIHHHISFLGQAGERSSTSMPELHIYWWWRRFWTRGRCVRGSIWRERGRNRSVQTAIITTTTFTFSSIHTCIILLHLTHCMIQINFHEFPEKSFELFALLLRNNSVTLALHNY